MSTARPRLALTGETAADRLLEDNPFALVVGMLLDQQISMELAFLGPWRLEQRLGAPLTPAAIAALDVDALTEHFRERPALHRYPGSMAARVHALATALVEEHGGDAAALWEGAADGADLKRRLTALPGFGDQKARILIALLGKRLGVRPSGWREAAGDYGLDGFRSIADVTGPDALAKVRETKQAAKRTAEQRAERGG
ncbi:MAG: hypothetical protein RLZZ272_588 [Actinomycetota bacterium]|jgi:uncharacterized HhH-GPD family protein